MACRFDSRLILNTLAPEIDIFEALVLPARNRGEVSMSAQWAPFDPNYEYNNATTDQAEFYPNTFETVSSTACLTTCSTAR